METDNQLEKSPEVNNHSIVTTNSGDREPLLGKTTPATSPIVSKTAPSSMAATSDNLFNRELEEYTTKMLELFKTRAAGVEVNEKATAQLNGIQDEFSWNKIVELSELIFNEYSNDMENITKELDIVNKVSHTMQSSRIFRVV